MSYATRLPDALHRRGLTVEVVPGWETRSAGTFNPRGAVCHWTAGPRTGDRPSLHVVTYGRSDLAGPLCNVFLSRAGVAVVVAAGRANHAGEGSWRGLAGNSSVFGTEAENSGSGEWTAAQRWAYPRICAAYLDLIATRDMAWICGHNEWAPTRKIDIRDWPMPAMRTQVAAVLAGTSTPQQEADMNAAEMTAWARSADGKKALAEALLTSSYYQPKFGGKTMPVNDVLTRIGASVDPDALATAVASKLGGSADAAAIKQAVREVLTEGTGGTP